MNSLQKTENQFLSDSEKEIYSKFRVPLIPCPSCGESHK